MPKKLNMEKIPSRTVWIMRLKFFVGICRIVMKKIVDDM